MIYSGRRITSNADKLEKITLDYLYHSIKNPKSDIESKIRQLRVIRDLDKNKYNLLKRELPYIVCGTFSPPFRRTENFAYIEYFIVDLDHIVQKELSIENIRKEIEGDSRTVMTFLSPGEDGLKIMFRLKDRCYDHGLYSLFYKVFVKHLSDTYHLNQVIDRQTCDVSRACFISCDPNVYFSPEAESVDMRAFIDMDNPVSLFEKKNEVDKLLKEDQKQETAQDTKKKDPDAESLEQIKGILKLKTRPSQKAPVYVPEQLNEIMENLQLHIEETGILVKEVINISYGKKIRMQLGMKQGEINVFYGKRGFSVVISPRCGTDSGMNQVAADVISNFFAL
ncbi:CRISPR-associated primase-polymerase type B [Bacteroides sp. OttesenSCG-928-E20]|nr:CRISPR-associated primase-polymerase type B [Bacteroides sp. OttesenSCG-928-N06]MDL2299154.1 CRISPR-associated primase-polymerase type B [Bacteroides sp. OttesenSCG-928-E20]MDL2304641.1 CRISPR-associated primase-polymerase type B [Bacteroides sp. OttesenSCG-928-D19]